MASTGNWKEYLLNISILSHPDELANPLIQRLIQTYPKQVTIHNTSSKSENVFILQLKLRSWRLTIYLVQPMGQLMDKMVSDYYTAIAGSIILFSNNPESFEAARAFYDQLRKINGNLPVLVTFIEVIDGDVPNIDEPEVLDDSPNVTYYGIKENDEEAFSKIIKTFINNYFGIQ
ncbi:MAG: hypothetical protein ACW991_03790 [Candidatus Hodarchaeales archaeon]|jgi:hypothetical protein